MLLLTVDSGCIVVAVVIPDVAVLTAEDSGRVVVVTALADVAVTLLSKRLVSLVLVAVVSVAEAPRTLSGIALPTPLLVQSPGKLIVARLGLAVTSAL